MKPKSTLTDRAIQCGLSLGGLALALIPLWIWLVARWMLNPEGFWQNFVLFGVGVWLLGAVQLGLFVIWLFWLAAVWSD